MDAGLGILALLIVLIAVTIGGDIDYRLTKHDLIRYRSRGKEVMKIQHMLNFINMVECKYTHHIREDGLFYEETLYEVKYFQASHQLTPDGLVGLETKCKIEMLYFTYKNDNRYGDYYRGYRGGIK